MTTLGVDDIMRAHAAFGPLEEIIDRRRAIYHAAVEMGGATARDDGVVDNPVVRAHLGQVLSGLAPFDPARLRHLDTLVDDAVFDVRGRPLRFAAADDAQTELAGALARVIHELGHRHGPPIEPTVLTGGSERAGQARATVVNGVELALEALPEVTADLLNHVALVAVLDGRTTGELGSASVREFPGLLLLPEPQTAVEVAEAIVHESAHQLFFDLAMTNSLLGMDHPGDARFSPPWGDAERTGWPFEQVVAAFHAYTCLAVLAERIPPALFGELSGFSLLPVASDRAGQLGRWLAQQHSRLGLAGKRFVRLLSGDRDDDLAVTAASGTVDELVNQIRGTGGPLIVRHCGAWTLVLVVKSDPPDLYWLPAAAAGRI